MAKKRRKPKLKFKAPKSDWGETLLDHGSDRDIKLAIWGVVAIFVIVVLVMYFAGFL